MASLILEFLANYAIFVMLGTGLVLVVKRAWFTLTVLFLAVTMSLVVTWGLKSVFDNPRPYIVAEAHPLISLAPRDGSFPSGHTAVAVAVAVAIIPLSAVWGMSYIVVAVMIGFSRVVGGVHAPIDILGGMGVGFVCGVASWLTVKQVSIRSNWQIDI